MAEDEERRLDRSKSGRAGRQSGPRATPPLIDGDAKDVTVPASLGETSPEQETDATVPQGGIVEPSTTPVSVFGDAAAEHPFEHQAAPEPREAERAEQTSDRTTPVEEPTNRSLLPTIAGLVALLLVAAIVYLFYAVSTLGPDLSPEIAELKTQVASLQARPTVDAVAISKRLDNADASVNALKASVADLTKRVVAAAGTPPVAGAAPPDLAPRVAAIDGQINDLTHNLGDLRTAVAEIPKPDFGPVNAKIGDVDQRLAALAGTVNALPRIDLGPLTAKVDDVDARLKPVEAEIAAAKSPQRVAERQAAPLAVTAQAILDAVGSGQAFPREFKALQALGADPVTLAPLQAVAESGAPGLADLQAELAGLRDRMIADGAPPAKGSYVDRLMAGAGTLVQVRPLGSVVGDTPASIVARMNADIGSDDIKAAIDEWKTLPDASRSVSKGLVDRLTLRLNAESAAKSIAATAIGAMAAPKG